MYNKHLQRTLEREDAWSDDWHNRYRKTYKKTFFFEPLTGKTPIENRILSLQAEICFLQEDDDKHITTNSKNSRIKKVQQKLNKLKLKHSEVLLVL